MQLRAAVTIALCLMTVTPPLLDVEERRAIGGLAAHVAAAFDQIAACQMTPEP